MACYPELTQRLRRALADPAQAGDAALLELYRECFGENCRRRDRILRRLSAYLKRQPDEPAETLGPAAALTSSSPTPMATVSENFRFKASFKDKKAIVHAPETRYVTAANLTDADVPTLQAYGRGHLVEVIPGREKQAEAALAKLAEAAKIPADKAEKELPSLNVHKADLQAIYEAELGQKPADELTVDKLKEAIEAHRAAPAK